MRKKTGELDLFLLLWDMRPHRCVICNKRLNEFSVGYFSHLCSKGSLSAARLDPENIEILCNECHYQADFVTHKAKKDSRFSAYFKKAEKIKIKYNNKKNYNTFR